MLEHCIWYNLPPWIPHILVRELDCAGIHIQVWVLGNILFAYCHGGMEVPEVWRWAETWVAPILSTIPDQGVSSLGGASQGSRAVGDGAQQSGTTAEVHDRFQTVEETIQQTTDFDKKTAVS